MQELIRQKLEEIEGEENCRILLAVESGSRAWGFASPDSDYDVRFIYVRPRGDYLKLEKVRDVIERPISGRLDINGWDAAKALRLLHKSNPTVFEWFSSPILYRDSPFAGRVRAEMGKYFSRKSGLWHYLHMAQGNYRAYLRGDRVKAKKYFYVLRPLLACRWILERGTPPPMAFARLAESQLEEEWKPLVDRLLELKRGAPEVEKIPRIDRLNAYLDRALARVMEQLERLPKEEPAGWEKLDALFLSALQAAPAG